MARWDPDIDLDATTVRDVLDAQFPELRAGARGVSRIGAGWDNAVWRVGAADDPDPIAFRFTQRHFGTELALRELAVLPVIAPLVPLAIPSPSKLGRTTDSVPLPWFGYELLPGDEAIIADLDADAQLRIARQLGEFLRALHAPEVRARVEALGIVPRDNGRRGAPGSVAERGRAGLEDLGRAGFVLTELQNEQIDAVFAASLAATVPDDHVFVHGDLHVRHVLTDAHSVTGIIDWGDMCIGPALIDFIVYWALLDEPARSVLLDSYGGLDDGSLAVARALALYVVIMIAESAADVGRRDVAEGAFRAIDRVLTPSVLATRSD